jgi:hypothetical protein
MEYNREYLSAYFIENIDIEEYYNSKLTTKTEKLDQFIKYWAGVKQHDKSWYALMYTTLGGSELAAILDKNKYKKRIDVINDKVNLRLGLNVFNGGAACTWGTMFEDVLGFCYERLFNTKIKGDDICIQIFTGHRNSPDGFSILNVNIDGEIAMNMDNIIDEKIALLEFKCPYSRNPAKVPPHYEIQVQSGLGVSPVAEFGLYADAQFRTCTYNSLKSSGYNNNSKYDRPLDNELLITFHNYFRHGKIIETEIIKHYPVYYGIIGVFSSVEKVSGITDFGTLTIGDFEELLGKIDKKIYTIVRKPIYDIGMIEWQDDPNFIGFIPWKLFKINITFIDRKHNFMRLVLPYILDVHREVDEIYAKKIEMRELEKKNINYEQDDYIREFTADDVKQLYCALDK